MDQENYIVTARKWRPNRFSDVAGQSHITKTLKNALSNNRMHHAYLFTGPRGVGKTTTARILARALNCDNPQDFEPCNECSSCQHILEGRSMNVIEIDGASNNSVDDVRKLRENAKYPPSQGAYKLYIIDEVHMLSKSAFNALLKILEEPPMHLIFVFATTEPQKLLPTILSRCQRYDFSRMEVSTVAERLKLIAQKEGIAIDEESLITIGKKADGSMRDGQSIFDQVVAFCGNNVVYTEMADALNLIDVELFFQYSEAIKNSDYSKIFNITDKVVKRGYDLQECFSGLLEHYRNIMSVKSTGNKDLVESSESIKQRYLMEAQSMEPADLIQIMTQISNAEQAMRFAPQPRVKFELTLLQLASMDSSVDLMQLLNELNTGIPDNPIKPQEKKTLIDNINYSSVQEDKNITKDYASSESITNQTNINNEVLNSTWEKPADSNDDSEEIISPQDSADINSTSNEDSNGLEKGISIDSGVTNNENKIDAQADKVEIISSASLISQQSNQPKNSIEQKDVINKQLKENWDEFLSIYANTKHNLHALRFTENVVAEFINNDELNIVTDEDFLYDMIYDNRDLLSDRLEEYYGRKIKFKVLRGDLSKIVVSHKSTNSIINDKEKGKKSSSTKPVDNLDELHPIERFLVEKFKAKELMRN